MSRLNEIKHIDEQEEGDIVHGYIPEMDRTVVFKEKTYSSEVVGFYCGEPREELTRKAIYGELKAWYDV